MEALFEVLRENGTISEGHYDRLIRALDHEAEVAEAPKQVKVETEGGVEASTYDGAFSFQLGGRLMVDAAFYDQDERENNLGDGTELRRSRIDVEGRMFHDWIYELAVDFADADGKVEVKDAYVGYEGWWPASFKVGQFKEPFSLEELTSSKYITFMERALPNEFAPGRNIGIRGHRYWESFTVASGVFGEAYDSDPDDEGDEGYGVVGRLTYAPIHQDTRALHLGAAAEYRVTDDEDQVRFRSRPESHVTSVRYVNTG